jgi:hypothetical protein
MEQPLFLSLPSVRMCDTSPQIRISYDFDQPTTRQYRPESRISALVGNPSKDLISLGRQILILILHKCSVILPANQMQSDRKDGVIWMQYIFG